MTEEFLYYLWKFRLFDNDIKTASGEEIRIISPGVRNFDSGPDFFNARISIGDTFWAGNVEIHIKSSEWHRHRHGADPAYDNIVLHVVYECDAFITRKNGEIIPVFEVKGCFDNSLQARYENILNSLSWVPCENMIGDVDRHYLNIWLERLVIERLERKAADVEKILRECNSDWEQTFFRLLAKCFGFTVNAIPFELLAKSLPIKYPAKHCDDLSQIEALLFGQAGFLNRSFKEKYPERLKGEYNYLSKKYGLQMGDRFIWKFLRLRPSNFPTVRIAQLAGLIYKSPAMFTSIVESESLNMVVDLFDVNTSLYWDTHYRFDKESAVKPKKLGKEAISLFIINSVVPVLYYYGKVNDLKVYQDRSIDFLNGLKCEINAVIRRWQQHGVMCDSASQSQALLELKSEYCDNKRCLNCSIGNYLIRK